MSMEIGAYTFAEVAPDPESGRPDAARRLRELLEEAEAAERAGLDVFGVGEHHRADFAVSAPAVALSAIAARTERLRLTSAVSVLSSDDPVRVFEEFAPSTSSPAAAPRSWPAAARSPSRSRCSA